MAVRLLVDGAVAKATHHALSDRLGAVNRVTKLRFPLNFFHLEPENNFCQQGVKMKTTTAPEQPLRVPIERLGASPGHTVLLQFQGIRKPHRIPVLGRTARLATLARFHLRETALFDTRSARQNSKSFVQFRIRGPGQESSNVWTVRLIIPRGVPLTALKTPTTVQGCAERVRVSNILPTLLSISGGPP